MLALHALDIADNYLIIISLPTFNFIFVKSSYALVSRSTNKSLQPINRLCECMCWPTILLFCILQNSSKNRKMYNYIADGSVFIFRCFTFPLVLHQGFGVAFGNFSKLRKIIHLMYTGKML